MSKTKAEFLLERRNEKCRLLVFFKSENNEDYFVFNVAVVSKRSTTLTFSVHYLDLTLCMFHAVFMYRLCTDIVDSLFESDKTYAAQIEKIKNEVNIRYNKAVEEFILDCGRRGIPVPFSNGSGDNMRRRRSFFENRQTRFDGISLPRDVDFLWNQFTRFPKPRFD